MQKNPLGKRIKPAKNIGSKILSGTLGKLAPKVGAKSATKLGAKAVGKGLLKKVPGLGLIAGVAFGLDRIINDGDWVGGLAEMASGAASTVPGVGTAVSTAIDVGLAAKDVTTPRKMACGGV
ncbi:unknown, partial [Synechococcus phage S-PM2]